MSVGQIGDQLKGDLPELVPVGSLATLLALLAELGANARLAPAAGRRGRGADAEPEQRRHTADTLSAAGYEPKFG